MAKRQSGQVAENRRARFDYHLGERYEAGISLTGSEVKSLRQGKAQLQEAYAILKEGEAFLLGAHIAPYDRATFTNHDPTRTRKLLLHKRELRELAMAAGRQGMTLVPIRLYFNDAGLAKLEIALGQGKKAYDKRRAIAERDAERSIRRALKRPR
jgi:SsrA-binding protein